MQNFSINFVGFFLKKERLLCDASSEICCNVVFKPLAQLRCLLIILSKKLFFPLQLSEF